MKKSLILVSLVFVMFSLVSAGVTMDTQPNNVYNLGDKIEFNIKIIPDVVFSEVLILKLSCGTLDTEVYKEYLFLEEETLKKITIPLVKSFIGESKGACTIHSVFAGREEILSNEFSISTLIKFNFKSPLSKLNPGEGFFINGTAYKDNGKEVNGIIEARLKNGDSDELFSSSEVIGGAFSLFFALPEGFNAGDHVINFYSYETNKEGIITNSGLGIDTIVVRQVPTNIEVFLEEKAIFPGETLRAKILLHDQSGEKIDSLAYIAIKNQEGEIVEKLERNTGVFFEYPINYTQAPSIWTIGAYSGEITNKMGFEIKEKREVGFELVNQTLVVKNRGNVLYEGIVNITVGNLIVPLEVSLDVGQEEKYVLSAPNGEYDVVAGDLIKRVSLTGNAINIKKFNEAGGFNFSIVWVFLIFVLGFVAYTIFKKGYKRSFFGRVLTKNKSKAAQNLESSNKSNSKKRLITPKNLVELSISIAGTKQNAVIGCLMLKNYDEIKSGEGNVHETLEDVVNMVESRKGLVYKNHGNLFYIFAPVMTKTFKNEGLALEVSNNILLAMKDHNRKFKKKMEFGLAVHYGTIVTKTEVRDIKFMTMGTLMTDLKKMATASDEVLYLGEKVKDKLAAEIKADMKEIGSLKVYEFKQMMKKTDHSPFIKGFMERQQKERMAKDGSKL